MLIVGAGDLVVMRPVRHARFRAPESLLHLVDGADLALANLEVPLTARDDPQRAGLVLRGDPELIEDVALLGFGALCVANNHCGDQGFASLREMSDALRAKGVVALGIGDDQDAAYEPVLVQAGGLKVGLVTATCVGFERYFATSKRPGMAGVRLRTRYDPDPGRLEWEPAAFVRTTCDVNADDSASLLAAVGRARSQADLVVVSMHWGVSWSDRVEPYQRELGAALAGAGASAVFGSHSHTVQGVEVRHGAPIFYGLGSFVFGYSGPLAARMSRDTALAMLEVDSRGKPSAARLVLGRLDPEGEPVRAHPERAELLAEIVARNSDGWGARVHLHGDTLEIGLS